MATVNLHNLTDTWNNGGTTFSGIKMDVTNTASAAGSKPLDIQVGSAEIFEVRVDGQTIVTTADASGLAVGPNGATNPGLSVDCSTASAATGVEITGAAATAGVAIAAISSGTNENLTLDAKGSGTLDLASSSTGAVTYATSLIGTSTSANALAVGANGTTNPVLKIDANTASVATGLEVTGAAAAAGLAMAVISSGTNENLTLDAKGSGTVGINTSATGAITLGTATTITGDATLSAGLIGTPQALSGAGAIDVVTLTTNWTTTAADAGTLADGTAGQIKNIVLVSDGGDGTLTPTNFGNGTTITFADVGDAVSLQFDGTNWWIIGSNGAPAVA